MKTFNYHSCTLTDTKALGQRLSGHCCPPFVVHLCGDLGVGKTTFVRAFLQAMEVVGRIKSPTYTLVEPYEFDNLSVYHVDLYRLKTPAEMAVLGLSDYLLNMNSILLIEWPDRGGALTPKADVICQIEIDDNRETGRLFHFIANTQAGEHVLTSLASQYHGVMK